jgi:hypothetical protein
MSIAVPASKWRARCSGRDERRCPPIPVTASRGTCGLSGRRHVGEPSMGECVVRRGVEIQASKCSGLVRPIRVGIVCATTPCAVSRWPPRRRIPGRRGRSGSPLLARGRSPPVVCSRVRRRCGTSRARDLRDHSVIARPGGSGMSRLALMRATSVATSSRWRLTPLRCLFRTNGILQAEADHARAHRDPESTRFRFHVEPVPLARPRKQCRR